MVSVQEALSIIENYCRPLTPVSSSLGDARGCILAEDIFSAFDIPAYAQSSMDGYAIRYEDKEHELKIIGEMQAGSSFPSSIGPGEATRIFTGAPLPQNADTVIMQEKIVLRDRLLAIVDSNLKPGNNVRPKGSEVKKGQLALPKGSELTTPAIGFLAGIGTSQVSIFPRPRVGLLLTGNELQEPGNPPAFGKVYDANSFMLLSALKDIGIYSCVLEYATDDLPILSNKLSQLLQTCDLVLLTGGVSVGDYDFVTKAAEKCGIISRFHKVRQRPGKPLYYGMSGNKHVFGLPGNPSSALTCFYIYVLRAISALQKKDVGCKTVNKTLKKGFEKVEGLTQFVKAYTDGEQVSILHAQESFRLYSFAQANCLVELAESRGRYEAGEKVITHLLDV